MLRTLTITVVLLTVSFSAMAEMKTCKDVIDSPESSSKSAELASIQKAGLRFAALRQGADLFRGLEKKGVANPIAAVLEYYESTLVPTRDEANDAINIMVKENKGNLSVAYRTFCPTEDTELFSLYDQFYTYFYKRRTEDKSN
jgi:hypothetical protein